MNALWKRVLIIGLILVAATVLSIQLVAADPYEEVVAVSAKEAGVTEDGLTYDAYDIIARETVYDSTASVDTTSSWYTLFNGEDFGLGTKHAIDAFSIDAYGPVDTACGLSCIEAIYMSFRQDAISVPGIAPKVQGEDIVVFDTGYIPVEVGPTPPAAGEFSLYFDGSDVGLTTRAEKIDGLDVWHTGISVNAEFPYDCSAGILFISTQGTYRVPAANGGALLGDGNDVLIFCATNLGPDTAGFWFRGFDASDHGWPDGAKNAMYGLDVQSFYAFSPDEQEEDEAADLYFYFVTKKTISVPNAFGGPSEIFGFPDCGGGVFGPVDDLNQTWPALNGTAAGIDLLNFTPTGDCAN